MSATKVSRAEKRRVEIATIKAREPDLTQREIAERLSVSPKTVQRALDAHREVVERRKEEHDRLLLEKLPIDECVDAFAACIRQDKHLPTRLNAIMRFQDVLGVGPKRDSGQEPQPQPLFSLPAGARVAVKVG